jgi:hypothetical protein
MQSKGYEMNIAIIIIGILNGAYMLIDGIYVLINTKFIGPEKPGPWSLLFEKLGADVFKLGPIFIIYGILWFAYVWAFWSGQPWANTFGIILAVMTLWYLPFGTIISIITIILLAILKSRAN